jgi:hypothetical protein
VFTSVVFIFKRTEAVAQICNDFASIESTYYAVPSWTAGSFVAYQVLIAILNFAVVSQDSVTSAFLTIIANAFVVSIGAQILLVHHLLWNCYSQMNARIAKEPVSLKAVAELRKMSHDRGVGH